MSFLCPLLARQVNGYRQCFLPQEDVSHHITVTLSGETCAAVLLVFSLK